MKKKTLTTIAAMALVALLGVFAAVALAGSASIGGTLTGTTTGEEPDPNDGKKVFVCKYVGTPGSDERLQTGDNPINPNANSIPDYVKGMDISLLVGKEFADAQGFSRVIAVDMGQDEPTCPGLPPEPDGGTLSVEKVLINDNGGTAEASDFSFTVNGGAAIPFKFDGSNLIENLPVGEYTVAEVAAAGYNSKIDNGTVEVKKGQTTTVTITNNDKKVEKGKLIVNKVVVNNDGGTKTAGDFSFTVNGQAYAFEADGSSQLPLAPGDYTIGEVAAAGYTSSIDDSTVTIVSKDITTVTITNDDVADETETTPTDTTPTTPTDTTPTTPTDTTPTTPTDTTPVTTTDTTPTTTTETTPATTTTETMPTTLPAGPLTPPKASTKPAAPRKVEQKATKPAAKPTVMVKGVVAENPPKLAYTP